MCFTSSISLHFGPFLICYPSFCFFQSILCDIVCQSATIFPYHPSTSEYDISSNHFPCQKCVFDCASYCLTFCTDGGRTEVSLCCTCSPCRPRLCGRLKSKRAGKKLSSLVHFTAVTSADRAMDHLWIHLSHHRPLVEQFGGFL